MKSTPRRPPSHDTSLDHPLGSVLSVNDQPFDRGELQIHTHLQPVHDRIDQQVRRNPRGVAWVEEDRTLPSIFVGRLRPPMTEEREL